MQRRKTISAKNVAIDDIDRKILRALCVDGRFSFRDLSQRVYLSPNATAERMRRLQSNGIIRGIHAVLDPVLLGLTFEAYIDVKLQTGTSVQQFETVATKLPGVVSIAVMAGSFDVRLRVACKDQAELQRLIEILRAQAGAKDTNSSVILREVETRNWKL
jgi:Lrp/AsnC family transcriptional regulator, leucine-responsive regulatory protein